MAMRFDCKNFDSRTYPTGEVVRKCRLDLAPNAPFECPENCSAFVKRTADVGWDYGSLAAPIIKPVEEVKGADKEDIAGVLDEAEDIVNMISPELFAEFSALDKSLEPKKKGKGLFGKKDKKKKNKKKKK
jgi:hypothetical protein